MLPITATDTAAEPTRLGFSDQPSEIVVGSLPIEGEIPSWLTGSLLRNGPARWDLAGGATVNHWFDGMAMLHRFAFSQGAVSYANRLLRGRAGATYADTGKLGFREFATDPCRSAFGRFMSAFQPGITDNGAVNVIRDGERWLAVTESPMAVEFDPRTLETLGVRPLAKGVRVPVAHPHVDRATGETIGLRVAFGPRAKYEITARTGDGDERLIAAIPVHHPAYQHSFGLTDRYAILGEHPLVVHPAALGLSGLTGKAFIENFHWEPERGSRFTAVDRATGEIAGTWSAPASFCFHHVNAFEDGETIVLDLVEFDDASIIDALRIDALRSGGVVPQAHLSRYRLVPGETSTAPRSLSDVGLELPRIDERFARQPYRRVYAAAGSEATSAFFDRIAAIDVETGEVASWGRPGEVPGEPVFVPRPGSSEEGDGVVLAIVLEAGGATSSMVVLDGRTLEEVGRARVPQHVPFGFHGGYSRDL